MLKDVLDQLGSLTLEEKRAVEEAARAAVARELGAQGAGAPESCPRCGCPSFVRKGRNRDGSQRWLCRGCGSTFSAKTMSLLAYSKLAPEVWSDYVSDMLSGASLRACAELCGVSLKTSWFMRMRLCEVMARATQPFRTGDAVSWQVDGTYLSESLKGNRSRSALKMPRKAHGHGGAVHERGISSLKVCVVCGANDLGDSFCRLAGRGRPTDAGLAALAGGAGALRARLHRRALGLRARAARPGRGRPRGGPRLRGRPLAGHGQRPAPAPQALPRPLRGRVHQVAVPLPGLVRVGRAGQAVRLEAGAHPLGAGLRRALRAHQGGASGPAAAFLGVLGAEGCCVNGGLTQSNEMRPRMGSSRRRKGAQMGMTVGGLTRSIQGGLL